MLLTFVAEMVIVGTVRHTRDQAVKYRELRSALANATAPTGQLDFEGKPVEPGTPVALIRIPSINVREVVLEGTTSGVLMSGPGHRRDTALPGQAGVSVIMGRQASYGGPFRRLRELKRGAEIAVTTGQGSSLYEVTGARLAGDTSPVLETGSGQLTLITGYGRPFLASDALRIDAKLKSPVLPSPSRAYGVGSLPKSEAAMAGDPGVLLPLLLWSQLLLVLAGVLAWVRSIWGRWQSWIVCVPIMAAVGLQVSHLVAQLLPNLL